MAPHYVIPEQPDQPRRGPPIEGAAEAEAIPCVPFIPWRCPTCNSTKPRTYSQHGSVRYHLCQECGLRFRSRELPASLIEEIPQLRGIQ